VIILSFGVGNIDHFCQKELFVIKNNENFLPETLYKTGFNKLFLKMGTILDRFG